MDYTKPTRPTKNYYFDNFNKKSKNAFLSEILEKCKDKEDPEVCKQKYLKAFDSVFETLKNKLDEEERASYFFDNRLYKKEGLASFTTRPIPTGYENWA